MPGADNDSSSASAPVLLKELIVFLQGKKTLSSAELSRALRFQAGMDKRFGMLAALKSFISPHDVIFLLSKQVDSNERMGRLAQESGLMTEEEVKEILRLQANPFRLFVELLVYTRMIEASRLRELLGEFTSLKSGGGKFPANPSLDIPVTLFGEEPAHLDERGIKLRLRRLRDLSTLPGVVHQILGRLQNPNVDMHEIATVIEGDPALSIRLLRLANSAFFGLVTRVGTVHKALVTLGVNNVRKTIITASILEKFKDVTQAETAGYWRHGLLTSRWTRQLLRERNLKGGILEDGLMAGLLHDTGKLAIWQFFPEANTEIRKLVHGGKTPDEAERLVISMSHPEIGAFLFQVWNFPTTLLQATCYHHAPVAECRNLKDMTPLTACVNIACRLSNLPTKSQTDGTEVVDPTSLDPEFLEYHTLNPDLLVQWSPAVIKEANDLLASFLIH
ncbi:MAG: HDOD domain-containing protein [Planctomycetota bacterium]